jgi:hypothetical protein
VSGGRDDNRIEPGEPWGVRPPAAPGEAMKGGGRKRPPIWLLLLLVLVGLLGMLAVMLGLGQ